MGTGIVAALIAAIIYGLIPILTKVMYAQGANAVTIAFLRATIATPILLLTLKLKHIPVRFSVSVIGRLFLFCGIPTSATILTFSLACAYIPAGTVSSLNFIYPTVVTLVNILLFREKASSIRIAAVLAGLGGVALFFSFASGVSIPGLFFALLSGVSYGVLLIATEHTGTGRLHPLQIAFYQNLFVTLLFGSYGVIAGSLRLNLSLTGWTLAILLSLLVSVVASALLFFAVANTGSSVTALLSTLTPIVSMTLGWIVLGETISFEKAIGMLLILVSVFLTGEFHRKLKPFSRELKNDDHSAGPQIAEKD